MVEVCVESRDAFAFAACCAMLAGLDAEAPRLTALTTAARDPDCRVACLAAGPAERRVVFDDSPVTYRVDTSPPLPTESKPEPYRVLVLRGASRQLLTRLVHAALDQHRQYVAERGGGRPGGGAIPTHSWDGDVGCWVRGKPRAARPLDTLFLPGHAEADVAQDLVAFYADAESLRALHVPAVRTYLLHGTPGSGKSSLVHCVASDMGYGLATLSFAPDMTDADVAAALARVPAQCLVLIEDIDCAFAGRASKNHGVSFASLLAALDGAWTDHPQAVFVTTNRLAELDPALRRRVDYVLQFAPATREQARRLVDTFFPGQAAGARFEELWGVAQGASMSVLQKYLVKVRRDGEFTTRLDVLRDLAACAAGDTALPPAMYG